MTTELLIGLYALASIWEVYLFLMQRASLELSRANDIDPKVGRRMLPLWYILVWPTKLARWILLLFIWSTLGWLALLLCWAIPLAVALLLPVPFGHFLKMFHAKTAKDAALAMTGRSDPADSQYAIKLLSIVANAEKARGN